MTSVFATGQWQGFHYEIIDGEATITNYTGSGGHVSIPATLEGYPVVRIGEHAFFAMKNLTKITFEEGLVTIGFGAFYGSSLEKVVFPATLASINGRAFAGIDNLIAAVFEGDTPQMPADSNPFNSAHPNFTIYHYAGGSGFVPENWYDYPLVSYEIPFSPFNAWMVSEGY